MRQNLGSELALLQRGRPIAFATKSLTQAEIAYAQVENELYAILFACRRFHQFTYGRRVIVHSDHRPLSTIVKKLLSAAPPRLQRMLLQLQKYSVQVEHRSGKYIPVSDYLSRASLPDTYSNLIDGLNYVHTVIQQLYVTDRRLEAIRQVIQKDKQMQTLKKTDWWLI